MKRLVNAFWSYYKDMNSEKGGQASIKRNLAWWTFFIACFIIEVYSVYRLPKVSVDEIIRFIELCKFYVIADLAFILIVLGITSIKEIKDAALSLRGGAPSKIETTETKTTEVS